MQPAALLYGPRQQRSPGRRRWWPSYRKSLASLEARLKACWGGDFTVTSAPIKLDQAREQLFVLSPHSGGNTISLRLSSSDNERVLIISCPQHNRDPAAAAANQIRVSLDRYHQDWGIDRLRTIISGQELLTENIDASFDQISGSNPYPSKKQFALLVAEAKQRQLISASQFLDTIKEGSCHNYQLSWLRESAAGPLILQDQFLAVNYRIKRNG